MQELNLETEPSNTNNPLSPLIKVSHVNGHKDQRRYARVSVKTPSTFTVGPWYHRKKINGDIVDWSQTGVGIKTEQTIDITANGTISFSIQYPRSLTTTTITGFIVRNEFTEQGQSHYGVRFEQALPDFKSQTRANIKNVVIKTFAIAVIVALVAIKIEHFQWFWYGPLFRFYSLMAAGFIATRFLFSAFYREPRDVGFLPSVSVIIAVKNEAGHIAETVRQIFKARYGKDRFEVIVIDDGSDDGTWEVLDSLRPEYPNLRLIKFPTNKGKRHGMAAGAQEAQGEILVYVDSDCFIEPDGIYRLVQPFHDPSVGAVAGHTKVRVEPTNIISKMESVRYFVSHQLFKASESIFGAVTCCPGAFSAYRKDLVLEALPSWLNQMFLGTPATFGDDRSLTNYILRKYQVLYHAGAVCFTYVPTTWRQFFRQQLRWKKSWAREATIAGRIMLTKNPLAALSFYTGIAITLFSPIVFLRAVLYGPLVLGTMATPYLLGLAFVYLALCIYYLLHTARYYWFYGLIFAFLYMTFFCWQTYYAILTINRNHWGTR